FNTGIGWHEARIPTISMRVPRGAYTWAASWLKKQVSIPVSATNRINTPELANEIVAEGIADLVSLARPFLADPYFVQKAEAGEYNRINTCIACNQACLDQIFTGEPASCLVNPFAARELSWKINTCKKTAKIAVVGGGVAGCAAAIVLKQRGFEVEVYEKKESIGGQFLLASQIPGKSEMRETLRYYKEELKSLNIPVHLNKEFVDWSNSEIDFFVLSTGVVPQELDELKSDNSIPVYNYIEAIHQERELGSQVAIIGSGGIAMDVATILASEEEILADYQKHWGIDTAIQNRGALQTKLKRKAKRQIHFIQRSAKKLGHQLGKTTVWSHRTELNDLGVQIHQKVSQMEISNGSLRLFSEGGEVNLHVDALVNCTGQQAKSLPAVPPEKFVVLGGVRSASGLDAKRAIKEATEWALQFEL
ncbi:MAG: FAD-dependent oxidoreductase, partial [Bacteroidota bacterium]